MVVDKLLKKYDKKVVVDSVSFSIPKGKVTSFIGGQNPFHRGSALRPQPDSRDVSSPASP